MGDGIPVYNWRPKPLTRALLSICTKHLGVRLHSSPGDFFHCLWFNILPIWLKSDLYLCYPSRRLFTHMEGFKIWPRLAKIMAIAQWGFFSVPYLLWEGSSLYNGHLLGPVTLTPVDGVLCSGAVTTCLNDLTSVATGNRTPISRMRGKHSEPYWWFLKNHMANYNLYPWLYSTNKLVITVMHIHIAKNKYLHSSNELIKYIHSWALPI